MPETQSPSAAQDAGLQEFLHIPPELLWQPYVPNASDPWDAVKVAHLYRRTSFGASYAEIQAGLKTDPESLVRQILNTSRNKNDDDAIAFEHDTRQMTAMALDSGNSRELQAVWLYRMLHSPQPLLERMTLFWHNHFATSNAKVRNLRLMQRQQDSLRNHALGSFDDLMQEMTFDPAMIIWLDGNTNQKGKPNENYAREIFELFSLGVGNYSEADIQEAARALTGWSVVNDEAVFQSPLHDAGSKSILGETGRWTAGDVVRIALAQPACPKFVVRKLFREFISDSLEPTDEMIAPLVEEFRQRNYDIGWIVGRMVRSWLFYSPLAIGQKVKSPVDFLVGSVKSLEGTMSLVQMAETCQTLGQNLYFPPSVKGWDGGYLWLNSTTLLQRQNMAFSIAGNTRTTDPAQLTEKYNIEGDETTATFFLDLFLQQHDPEIVAEMTRYLQEERLKLKTTFQSDSSREAQLARKAAHLTMTMPEYQLS
ncbi:MAG: DUF1800 domain-containing protein [Planctomycetota bacterium]|nr:DUF1800 domain-containing protein [Planctomycetota bacterium]MDA1212220.1 DUF1800 domain-containing protein [Planctomycetota bacterium]